MDILKRLDVEIKRFDQHIKWSLTDEEGYDFEAADLRKLLEDAHEALSWRKTLANAPPNTSFTLSGYRYP